jgi:outer membrane protein assembly factor BamB
MTRAARSVASARAACLAAALAALLGLLAACSSGPDKPKPTPLETVAPKIAGKQVWSQSLSGIGFPMRAVGLPGSVTVASSSGTVVALNPDTGRELWRGDVGGRVSAGVGSDGRYAGVVTTDNELVVLDGGKTLWRARLGTRVVTPPLVAGERVFVLGVDRSVQAFDVLDGRKLWLQQRPGDPLTLLQPGVLLPWNNTLVVGQGPRLAGFDPLRGLLRWETTVASPRGTNEIERLADLVGPAARVAESVCVRGFQAAVGCVNAETGGLAWTKNVGGTQGVTADDQFVFAADATDRITAWKRTAGGEVAWTSERLLHRGLSSPLVVGRTLVFGDFEGQMHFLDRETGLTLLRLPTDGSALVGAPVRVGTTIVAVTQRGGVYAFRPE